MKERKSYHWNWNSHLAQVFALHSAHRLISKSAPVWDGMSIIVIYEFSLGTRFPLIGIPQLFKLLTKGADKLCIWCDYHILIIVHHSLHKCFKIYTSLVALKREENVECRMHKIEMAENYIVILGHWRSIYLINIMKRCWT